MRLEIRDTAVERLPLGYLPASLWPSRSRSSLPGLKSNLDDRRRPIGVSRATAVYCPMRLPSPLDIVERRILNLSITRATICRRFVTATCLVLPAARCVKRRTITRKSRPRNAMYTRLASIGLTSCRGSLVRRRILSFDRAVFLGYRSKARRNGRRSIFAIAPILYQRSVRV